MTRRDGAVRGWRPERVAIALLLAGLVAVAGCSGAAVRVKPAASASTRHQPAAASADPATSPPRPGRPAATALPVPIALPVVPGAGSLHQTSRFPSTTTTPFKNVIYDLWLAVSMGNASLAGPAFFPEAAYVQLKAIANPKSDWQDRLWYDFTLDVTAAHALVGRDARFVRVIVPTSYAAWVSPGACSNTLGYWHVPGARIVYERGGETRSFGIASLISWRGEWYVVHFGAVLRSGASGEVDDPQTGPGTPGPPGGC